MTTFPVVLPIAELGENPQGREKIAFLSERARDALRLSAERMGIVLGELKKNANGAPQPFDGNHWSLSHKPKCVAAVVSRERTGIDVEEVRPRPQSLFGYVATEEEWKISNEKSLDTFFRYWTAKEAVLKALGRGIDELKRCKITSMPKQNCLTLAYQDFRFCVEQLRYQDHIVSVVKHNNPVEWVVRGA